MRIIRSIVAESGEKILGHPLDGGSDGLVCRARHLMSRR